MASQITKNKTMKTTLRRLLLAIWLYTSQILRHRTYPQLRNSQGEEIWSAARYSRRASRLIAQILVHAAAS